MVQQVDISRTQILSVAHDRTVARTLAQSGSLPIINW